MLCPEVWEFAPSPPSFSQKICESENEVFRIIKTQHFYHNVSVILPNTLQSPSNVINALLQDSQFYKISDIPVSAFLNEEFLHLFVENGHLTALSVTTHSEQNDSLAFIPGGKLILVLSRKTYQELGISNYFVKYSSDKHVLVLDLSSDFNKQKKISNALQNKFLSYKNLCFDVILSWEPHVPEVCPSSIACYFSKKGYTVKSCNIHFKQRHSYNVALPVLDNECDFMEFIEWIGAFSLQCDKPENSYISTMKYTGKCEEFGQVTFLNFTGLIPVNRLIKMISEINDYIKTKSLRSWISLVVQGFEESFIGIKNKQLFKSSGDHHHTIIFQSNGTSLVFSFCDIERLDM